MITKKIGILALALTLCGTSHAFAIDKIYSPNIAAGEWEMEYFGTRSFDSNSTKDNEQKHEVSIGYGVNNHWATEFYGLFDKKPEENSKMTGVEWENRVSFFEPGQYWMDSGLLLAYTQAFHSSDTNELEAKLLLEKQHGKFLHRLNAGVEQEVGPHSEGGPKPVLAWSSRYMLNSYFQPGAEIQSDFGKTTDRLGFNEQEHYVGPAVYGHILPHLKYEAAYLAGVSKAAASGSAKLLLEYEIFF